MMGIYMIRNNINEKVYIGQSVQIEERWSAHKRIAQNDFSIQYPLYLAIRKYGIENFTFSIIEECTQELLNEKEKYWIKFYHSCVYDEQCHGYNLTFGGDGHQQLNDQEVEQIINLWNEGKSTGEIETIVNHNKHCILKYLKAYSDYTPQEGDRRGRIRNGVAHKKIINVYDKQCVFLKQCAGYQQLVDEFEIAHNSISSILNGKYCWYKGYYLLYNDIDQKEELLQRLKRQNPKQVLLLKDDNTIDRIFFNSEEIKTFLSREVVKAVYSCCGKRVKTAYGQKWMYLYDYIEENGYDYAWLDDISQRITAIKALN